METFLCFPAKIHPRLQIYSTLFFIFISVSAAWLFGEWINLQQLWQQQHNSCKTSVRFPASMNLLDVLQPQCEHLDSCSPNTHLLVWLLILLHAFIHPLNRPGQNHIRNTFAVWNMNVGMIYRLNWFDARTLEICPAVCFELVFKVWVCSSLFVVIYWDLAESFVTCQWSHVLC